MIITNDAARLAADHRYEILDPPPDTAFDNIAALAARKQAQLSEELRERTPEEQADAEQGFRRAFEHAPIGMATLGVDLLLIEVNAAFCDMLGYRETALLLCSIADFVHPDDTGACLSVFSTLASGELRTREAEVRYLTADGKVILVRVRMCSTVAGADGHPTRLIAQFEDITGRKAAEALA